MLDLNNNKKSLNLPAYINIPFFLYQDERLEKSATLIAAFFYSLHTSGLKITASTDYLCALASIHKRQFYKVMNTLEDCHYIKRSGFTNRKKIQWVYCPQSAITVIELNTSALEDTSDQEPNNTLVNNDTLVHSTTLNLCTRVHTYIKEDTKSSKKLTTEKSSSSFFSEKQKQKLLNLKLPSDSRVDELFLEHCQRHVESQINEYTKFQRMSGLIKILLGLQETQEHFKAKVLPTKLSLVKEEGRDAIDQKRSPSPTQDQRDYDDYVKQSHIDIKFNSKAQHAYPMDYQCWVDSGRPQTQLKFLREKKNVANGI